MTGTRVFSSRESFSNTEPEGNQWPELALGSVGGGGGGDLCKNWKVSDKFACKDQTRQPRVDPQTRRIYLKTFLSAACS